MRGAAGYTLIELMVVVTIMGVMASVAVMQLDGRKINADKVNGRMMLVLQRAKVEAMMRSAPVGCQIGGNGGFCFVRGDRAIATTAYALADGAVKDDAGDVDLVVGQFRIRSDTDVDAVPPDGLAFDGTLGSQFFFLPDGIVVDTDEAPFSGGFTLRNEGVVERQLMVYQSGAIQNVTAQ